jgi:raffinose/stachyose/melibiose transport system permease protein
VWKTPSIEENEMIKRSFASQMPGRILVYLYALFLLVPMFFIIVTSLKPGDEIYSNPLGLPHVTRLENFTEAFAKGNMARYGLNSIIVSVCAVGLALCIAVIVTFCIYKLFQRKIGKAFYSVVISSMFIPATGWVTMIVLYQKLHLYNNFLGLILSAAFGGLAFNLFILLGFFRSIPRELEEAAVMDGCRDSQSLFHVLIPVVKSALVALGIFAFVGSWNGLLGPLLLLKNRDLFTIPLGLMTFKGTYTVTYNLMFAAILMSAVPLVVVYLKFQNSFVEALTGSIKG